MESARYIQPQPGPQTQFLSTDVDVCFYGGAAGGGKSYALCMDAGRWVDVPGFTAIIFRRTYPEITGAGSLWDTAREIFQPIGGRARENHLDWKWASGAVVKFGHMQHEKNIYDHMGKQYTLIGFDELTHFTPAQFWYLLSRNRSTCGVKPYFRGTCNAEPGWVADFIDWWIGDDGYVIPERCGVVRYFARGDNDDVLWADRPEDIPPLADGTPREPMSFTFIASDLSDNQILTEKDPGYRAKLVNLPKVERERLLGRKGKKGGNWKIQPAAGLYFRREHFKFVTKLSGTVVHWARGWDKAASQPTAKHPDPDWTVGVRVGRYTDGRFVIDARNIVRMRGTVREVEKTILRAASWDGADTTIALWQDPGQAGVVDREQMTKVLAQYAVQFEGSRQDKTHFWGPVSSQVEQGHVEILLPVDGREPAELTAMLHVLENVPEGEHDDDADALARAYLCVCNPPMYRYQGARPDRSKFEV